ncbi:uncharacterized protein [Blastocystis hominis]|uniref:Superoxide dismutase copper/zinc binding domain-containing protein n=1 Tax=Blastocystis hominis TaxID=12968 RepID=D8LYH4_BLAHO|nr:uncharacterized protein [Blastocystis hominis]CBK20629.2 unnamed protein product [Blastocystis hominis]|eukprot:XP_012894677.1 uncharacterized protein [Blastocystis hominis]
MAKVICYIVGNDISGTVTLTQETPFSNTIIDGTIKGLPKGKHGISINTFGDLTDGFRRCGSPHFNPFGKRHGSPNSDERHVGSLGNISSDGYIATFHIEDSLVQVMGPFSVIGRSIIVYENEDDLGLGSNRDSSINGNVGKAIAGGVIGIAAF